MSESNGVELVRAVYQFVLGRAPNPEELGYWASQVASGLTPEDLLIRFGSSAEYKVKHAIPLRNPPGHYYSPVVDPSTVKTYVAWERSLGDLGLSGVPLSRADIAASWNNLITKAGPHPFPRTQQSEHRYFFENGFFAYGDGITLRAIMMNFTPRRVIEIGSGYSSACMLDSADELKLGTHFTFIEPYPDRLRSILRDGDWSRCALIEAPVQEVSLAEFASLERNDILFIDSTHVLKTGSDVHYELCHILPALKPGVIIHFHDIHYPFEYPDPWIYNDNVSWNEIYALRLFLSYNSTFKILFWGSYVAANNPELCRATSSDFLINPGGSIWIKKA